jgi:pimeloyl-ACP methyl ester carboxylesterase
MLMKQTIHTFIIAVILLSSQILFAQTIDTVDTDWMAFAQRIDGATYAGRKFILKAVVKTEIIDDSASAGLWFRVDKLNGKTGFFYNMYDKPIRDKNWKYYTIEGTIDSTAKSLVFGGICYFNGRFYFDDFSLQVENNGTWENIAIENAGFENELSNVWKTGIGRKEIIVKKFSKQIIGAKPAKGKSCLSIKSTQINRYGQNNQIGQYFETNKVKLYYEVYGKGQPLLLLHGNGQSIDAMRNQIDFFKKQYQVIIPDCRGRGKSTDTDEPLTYAIQAADMTNLLNHLKIDSAHIIGWSDGGIIGLIMAKDFPSKVKSLIASGANVLQDTTAYFPEQLNEFKTVVADKNYPKSLKKLYQLMLDYPTIPFADLGKIKCPTMIVAGDKDEIRIRHTIKIFESIPKAQLFIVPGTSHYVLSENAKVFNTAAFKFLNQ